MLYSKFENLANYDSSLFEKKKTQMWTWTILAFQKCILNAFNFK